MNNVMIRPASPLKRFLAFVIEILVIIAYMVSVTKAFGDVYGEDMGVLIGLSSFALIQLALMTRATTIGKLVLNMKVVNRRTGKNLKLVDMIFRECLGKWISTVFFAVGFIWIMVDNENRAWHDMIFGSMVVETVHVPQKEIDEHDDDFYVKG